MTKSAANDNKSSKLDNNLNRLSFYLTPNHPCPYLPDKQAKTAFLSPEIETNTQIYSALISQGLRRSGEHIYKPYCDDCQACISVRIPVANFNFSRSQKRCLKTAVGFSQSIAPAAYTDQHYTLFERYINHRHKDGDMYPPSPEQYQSFLLNDSIESNFLNLTDPNNSQLICTAVYDQVKDGLSAVYTYFEPSYAKYSLGTLAILKLIEQTQRQGLDYLYLGYWIQNSQKMAYKGKFRPLQCFINNQWLELT
jgi:leucyl-tRNA---protein transferase